MLCLCPKGNTIPYLSSCAANKKYVTFNGYGKMLISQQNTVKSDKSVECWRWTSGLGLRWVWSQVKGKVYRPALGLMFDDKVIAAFSGLWRCLGQADFSTAVMDVLDAVCPTDSCGVLVFYRQRKPLSLLHRFNPVDRKVSADIYSTGPYALDPQYRLFLAGCPTGAYWLRDVAPDDFYSSEYYETFYSKTGVADSIDVLWRIDEDSALVFFMQRNIHSSEFTAADLTALNMVLPILSEALTKHYQLAAALPLANPDDKTHQQVECTLSHFASSLLTKESVMCCFICCVVIRRL